MFPLWSIKFQSSKKADWMKRHPCSKKTKFRLHSGPVVSHFTVPPQSHSAAFSFKNYANIESKTLSSEVGTDFFKYFDEFILFSLSFTYPSNQRAWLIKWTWNLRFGGFQFQSIVRVNKTLNAHKPRNTLMRIFMQKNLTAISKRPSSCRMVRTWG